VAFRELQQRRKAVFAFPIGAEAGELPPWAVPMFLMIAMMTVMMFVILVLFLKQYRRCPPNRIMVIYGKASPDGSPVCVHGGARLIVPVFQDYSFLSLEPIRVEISRQVTSSGKTIADPLPRVFSVAIGTEPELMQAAAARLLGPTLLSCHCWHVFLRGFGQSRRAWQSISSLP
jgi:uncharacterized membrane protein YqiK